MFNIAQYNPTIFELENPLPNTNDSKEFLEGYRAGRDGKDLIDNPYNLDVNLPAYEGWEFGWLKAERERYEKEMDTNFNEYY